jgi:hypothetical protein
LLGAGSSALLLARIPLFFVVRLCFHFLFIAHLINRLIDKNCILLSQTSAVPLFINSTVTFFGEHFWAGCVNAALPSHIPPSLHLTVWTVFRLQTRGSSRSRNGFLSIPVKPLINITTPQDSSTIVKLIKKHRLEIQQVYCTCFDMLHNQNTCITSSYYQTYFFYDNSVVPAGPCFF